MREERNEIGIMQLEICIETLSAGMAAKTGGASRIELCSALSVGGLTPSHGFISAAVEQIGLPIHVLLRPRAGDFVYSDQEFRIMRRDLEHARRLGAQGCVFGILDRGGRVDFERTRDLARQAAPMEVTFHRAIDRSRDLSESLEQVIATGCTRVLTSGGMQTAAEGAPTLAALVRQAAGRVRIAAGGGVTIATATELLATATVDLHASLLRHRSARESMNIDPLWDEETNNSIDPADVRALASFLEQVSGVGQAPR
jgi:copper homeostasis protein